MTTLEEKLQNILHDIKEGEGVVVASGFGFARRGKRIIPVYPKDTGLSAEDKINAYFALVTGKTSRIIAVDAKLPGNGVRWQGGGWPKPHTHIAEIGDVVIFYDAQN